MDGKNCIAGSKTDPGAGADDAIAPQSLSRRRCKLAVQTAGGDANLRANCDDAMTASLRDRLLSIAADADLVERFVSCFPGYAVVPNPRCGLWYCRSSDPLIQVYFQSKDGHVQTRGFSLRRLNVTLVDAACRYKGCVLVDSTHNVRKRMPDSFSRTVPIWCAVLNRAVKRLADSAHPAAGPSWDTALHTPRCSVSAQDHADTEDVLDVLVDVLLSTSDDKVQSLLLSRIARPLLPMWAVVGEELPELADTETSHWPVVCLTASPFTASAVAPSGFTYVKGAGDDHETWSCGLEPEAFWASRAALLEAAGDPDTLEAFDCAVKDAVRRSAELPKGGLCRVGAHPVLLGSLEAVYGMSWLPLVGGPKKAAMILLTLEDDSSARARLDSAALDVCVIKTPSGKQAKGSIEETFQKSLDFASEHLAAGRSVVVACEDGRNLSAAVVLSLLVKMESNASGAPVDKNMTAKVGAALAAECPGVHIGRSLIVAVNRFFISTRFKEDARRAAVERKALD